MGGNQRNRQNSSALARPRYAGYHCWRPDLSLRRGGGVEGGPSLLPLPLREAIHMVFTTLGLSQIVAFSNVSLALPVANPSTRDT